MLIMQSALQETKKKEEKKIIKKVVDILSKNIGKLQKNPIANDMGISDWLKNVNDSTWNGIF